MIDGTRTIFHRIEPGSFKMGLASKQVDVTITKPFELMATPMTQVVWKKIAKLVAKNFPGKHKIIANPSHFKGDARPVETVSYDDVQIWILALNELSVAGEPELSEIIKGHNTGDVYRLPTEAEWEFVIRGRGQYNDNYHFGNDESLLGDYAWYKENSSDQTQPVAQKNPLRIEEKEFYDMYGNVWEWVQDGYLENLPGGMDPQVSQSGNDTGRVVRGGSWSGDLGFKLGEHYQQESWERSNEIGFRLVRIVQSGGTL